jgi:hypothetical protein
MITPQTAYDFLLEELHKDGEAPESVFYVEAKSTFIMKYELAERRRDMSMAGQASEEKEFHADFDLDSDGYLRDHKVRDAFVLPVSLISTLFSCLGRTFYQTLPTLCDFRFHSPIIISGRGVSLFSKLRPDEDGANQARASLRTSLVHADVVVKHEGPLREVYPLDPARYVEFPKSDIYQFARDVIVLDDDIQVLDKIYRNPATDDVLSQVDTSCMRRLGYDAPFDFMFQLLEVGIQTAGAMGVEKTKRPSLPQRFESLRWGELAAFPQVVLVAPVLREFITNGFVADLYFVAPEAGDAVICKVTRIEFHFLERA